MSEEKALSALRDEYKQRTGKSVSNRYKNDSDFMKKKILESTNTLEKRVSDYKEQIEENKELDRKATKQVTSGVRDAYTKKGAYGMIKATADGRIRYFERRGGVEYEVTHLMPTMYAPGAMPNLRPNV